MTANTLFLQLCMNCGEPREPAFTDAKTALDGWLVETRPTLGGGVIEIVLCFPCRNLVPAIDPDLEYSGLPTGDESP